MLSGSEANWDYQAAKNDRFVDMACYYLLEKLKEHFEETYETVEDGVLAINDYITHREN